MQVVTALQAAARDLAAISAGIGSQALMRRAGEGAARSIVERIPEIKDRGAVIFVGAGNNGGDGWIAAAALSRGNVPVEIRVAAEPQSTDAIWARGEWQGRNTVVPEPAVVVDALVGTGFKGEPRREISRAIDEIAGFKSKGAKVVSFDAPSGLDLTTGLAQRSVSADLTISFGTLKRGQLMRRDLCGALVVVDIGLGVHADLSDGASELVDARFVRERLPRIGARAHKGSRGRLLMIGGSRGMAGAIALAARAALASGVGMVKCCIHDASIVPVQSLVPEATAAPWPTVGTESDGDLLSWPHALLIGPGLGLAGARERTEGWLRGWKGPVVLDGDALSAFEGSADTLRSLLSGRVSVLTPHAAEAARLFGSDIESVTERPFEAARDLARMTGSTVVLKGVPTVVAEVDRSVVSPRGTPVLATGGSGDMLSGIVSTLLAQDSTGLHAGGIAAFVHGRAAELATVERRTRGQTLADVMDKLPKAWELADDPLLPGELVSLPAVGED